MSKSTALLDQHGQPVDLDRLACRIFHIANVLDVLGGSLPEDMQGDPPAKCLTLELSGMAETIAIEVSEFHFDERAR